MQDGNFELGKLGWYTVETVEPNEFINGTLESEQYGIYYNVKFLGEASSYLWQAKTSPVAGEKVYGHVEMAKSGKSMRFKRAKKEDTPQDGQTASKAQPAPQQSPEYWDDKNLAIKAQWAINAALQELAATVKRESAHSVDIDGFMEKRGKFYFELVDRVKGSTEAVSTPLVASPQQTTGYDKAQAQRATLAQADKAEDEEIKSLLAQENMPSNFLLPEDE